MKTLNKQATLLKLKEHQLEWDFNENGIEKDFLFPNFVKAFEFMTKIAVLTEQHKHHPNWSNVYNNVHIRLTTHDFGGVTQKDINLAIAIHKI